MSTTPLSPQRAHVGLAQAASIFWGLTSLVFASATCYYYIENRTEEGLLRTLQDNISYLNDRGQTLEGEQNQLRSANSANTDAETLLNTKEQVLNAKEQMLAQKETHLEGLEARAADEQKGMEDQAVVLKYFNICANKLVKTDDSTVLLRPDNRPVLRLPNNLLFAANDATLKSSARDILNKLSQSLADQLSKYDLRVEVYGDKFPEVAPAPGPVERPLNVWNLTTLRAAALQRFFHDQGNLPNDHVYCLGRGDLNPISDATVAATSLHNRRTEIYLVPQVPPIQAGALELIPPTPVKKSGTETIPDAPAAETATVGETSSGPVVDQGPHAPPPDVPRGSSPTVKPHPAGNN